MFKHDLKYDTAHMTTCNKPGNQSPFTTLADERKVKNIVNYELPFMLIHNAH